MMADSLVRARQLARWRNGVRSAWNKVRVESVETRGADPMRVGGELAVKARIQLGNFTPGDVEVQLFHGAVDAMGEITQPKTVKMGVNEHRDGSIYTFAGTIPCRASGQHGYAVRVLPSHPDLPNLFEPGLICWG
jgi:glycogen phosphorylase